MYSPSFIESQLMNNVQSLVDWENTARSYQLYYGVIEQIQASEGAIENFTANAIDATLQVQYVQTSVSLNSSYTQGKFASSQYGQSILNTYTIPTNFVLLLFRQFILCPIPV